MRSFLAGPRSERGVTLIEMLLVVGIMGVVGAMGAAQIAEARRSMQGDGAMRLVMAQFNTARQMAVTQRRNMQLRFVGTNWMQIVRSEVPAGTTTLVSQAFEGNVTYRIVPTVTADTPDGFGRASAVAFGSSTTSIMFSSDGTLIDQAGNPLNGTVFLAVVNVAKSQRAVTVLGATGRVRGYKWACNWNNSVCGWNRV
jgi:prepilin-type N-terminal cleavage/methylation domain-containing protein